jgi:DNA-nicking Smr family endonuclease
MTVERAGGRGRRRALSAEDRRLWESVTRSVEPLRRRAEAPAADAPPTAGAETAADQRPALPTPPPAPERSAPPPLASLDRRGRQRIARGRVAIAARIDLHGLTQARAHAELRRFLHLAQANDARLVLVITGKGARAADTERERGVLRRLVPQWLASPDLRGFVVGFEPAHAAHGGDGALYVRVRRARG